MLPKVCKLYAMAMRLTRVWCVLAMVTQAYFAIGGITRGIVRGKQRLSYGVLAIGLEIVVEALHLLGVEGHQELLNRLTGTYGVLLALEAIPKDPQGLRVVLAVPKRRGTNLSTI